MCGSKTLVSSLVAVKIFSLVLVLRSNDGISVADLALLRFPHVFSILYIPSSFFLSIFLPILSSSSSKSEAKCTTAPV